MGASISLVNSHFSPCFFIVKVFFEQRYQFVELVVELVVGHELVVYVCDGKGDGNAALLECGDELLFVEAVALACEAFDAIAVDSVVEFALGGHDEHLAGHFQRRLL